MQHLCWHLGSSPAGLQGRPAPAGVQPPANPAPSRCASLAVQVTQLLLEPTWRQWAADTAAVASELPAALEAPMQAAHALLVTFERWLLQLKALRRMVIFGFPSDARSLQQVGRRAGVGNTFGSHRSTGCCLRCITAIRPAGG